MFPNCIDTLCILGILQKFLSDFMTNLGLGFCYSFHFAEGHMQAEGDEVTGAISQSW